MDDFDDITTGARFLSPAGRIWTVQAMTAARTRVVLTSDEADGVHGAVMDVVAVLRMVRIDRPDAVTAAEPAQPDAATSAREFTTA
jgi:hypothetical protein